MSLITSKPQLAQDQDFLDSLVLQSAEALNHAAAVITNGNRRFWEMPTERLLAILNDNVARTLAIFGANTATGQAINGQLDALGRPQFPNRIPTAPGRSDIVFSVETGQFVIAPPAPAEDPQP